MRIAYLLTVGAFLAGTPAVADVTITSGTDTGAQHQYQADQDRAAGRQNMDAAHQEAAMGNYGNAARDRAAAHEDRHAAHGQEHAADRDNSSGVTVQLSH
ncbi:MAG TPA: hypothetical protein VGG99_08895 [Acetobacteraceae bacterium]|jgi:hypothetical protein